MQTLNSTIKAVTVFIDRAQVIRLAEAKLTKGINNLRFSNLPDSVESKSIQVNGKGKGVLKNIKFKEVYNERIDNEAIKSLYKRKKEIQDEIKIIKDDVGILEKEKEYIGRMMDAVLHTTEKKQSAITDTQKMQSMMSFYVSSTEKLNKNLRDKTELATKALKQLDEVNKQINKSGNVDEEAVNVVDITIDAEGDETMILSLSYIVYGASWEPIYNIRVNSETKKMSVEYNASLSQTTGEDWNDVNIKLSTASVQLGADIPKISPWYVNKYMPPIHYSEKPKVRSKKKMDLKERELDNFAADMELEEMPAEGFGMISGKGLMPKKEVTKIEKNLSSVVFVAEGLYTIKADGSDFTVMISAPDIDTEFEYFTVPKLSKYAYLKSKFENKTNYPFLEGEANIFLDNNFVAEVYMNTIQPTEKSEVSLGVDESIKIEHKLIKKYNKHEGIFNKKNVVIYEYQTEIQNTKKTEELLFLSDNIPVSNHDDIKVELITPKYKEDTENLTFDKQGVLKQKYVLEPAKKASFDLKFSVEYPRDFIIDGL